MKKFIAAGASFLLPAIAFAAPTFDFIEGTLDGIQRLVEIATPVVIGLAMLFFLYGLMKFVLSAGDEEKKKEGQQIMIWGIVALFVMVSVWGLVNLLGEETGVEQGGDIDIPEVPR